MKEIKRSIGQYDVPVALWAIGVGAIGIVTIIVLVGKLMMSQ